MSQDYVLVVDDNIGICRLIYEILIGMDINVKTAQSGEEAIRITLVKNPLLAIVDMKMPNINGDQLILQLKNINPNIQCVLMTAYSDIWELKNLDNKIYDNLIKKPFDINEIRETVKVILKKGKKLGLCQGL